MQVRAFERYIPQFIGILDIFLESQRMHIYFLRDTRRGFGNLGLGKTMISALVNRKKGFVTALKSER